MTLAAVPPVQVDQAAGELVYPDVESGETSSDPDRGRLFFGETAAVKVLMM